MKKSFSFFVLLTLLFSLAACNERTDFENTEASSDFSKAETENQSAPKRTSDLKIKIKAGEKIFSATLEDCEATKELLKMLPFTVSMSDYGGFEKVGKLSKELPASNRKISAKSGDIVLYNGNQIVLFYGSNTWDYTILGRIDDLSGWNEALNGEKIDIIFSIN